MLCASKRNACIKQEKRLYKTRKTQTINAERRKL